MDRLKKYDDVINMSGDKEKIEKNNELNYKAYCKLHETDKDMLKWIKLEKRELAYGEMIDNDMILEVLPTIKWTTENTNEVKMNKGWSCDDMNFNFMANLYAYKYGDILEDDKILELAHKDSTEAYKHWKIMRMYK